MARTWRTWYGFACPWKSWRERVLPKPRCRKIPWLPRCRLSSKPAHSASWQSSVNLSPLGFLEALARSLSHLPTGTSLAWARSVWYRLRYQASRPGVHGEFAHGCTPCRHVLSVPRSQGPSHGLLGRLPCPGSGSGKSAHRNKIGGQGLIQTPGEGNNVLQYILRCDKLGARSHSDPISRGRPWGPAAARRGRSH